MIFPWFRAHENFEFAFPIDQVADPAEESAADRAQLLAGLKGAGHALQNMPGFAPPINDFGYLFKELLVVTVLEDCAHRKAIELALNPESVIAVVLDGTRGGNCLGRVHGVRRGGRT